MGVYKGVEVECDRCGKSTILPYENNIPNIMEKVKVYGYRLVAGSLRLVDYDDLSFDGLVLCDDCNDLFNIFMEVSKS